GLGAGGEEWRPVDSPGGSAVPVRGVLEGGGTRELTQLPAWVNPRMVDGVRTGRATFRLPGDLPPGWHEHVAVVDGREAARCTLAVTPAVPSPPPGLPERAWGVMAQLYSVRSRKIGRA